MEEEYKTISYYDNYLVSNLRNVKNTKTNKILKPHDDGNGYHRVNLYNNNKSKHKKIHRLVAGAFIGNPENKKCIDHIDNNKQNNNNLRWCNYQENRRNSKLSSKNTSGIKRVHFNKKTKKYSAQITIDGNQIQLGYFENIEDAKQTRIIKARKVFGVYINSCES